MYVLKRVRDGMYVAKRGSYHSYTNDRQQAAEFRLLEKAEKERCGNERIYKSFPERYVGVGVKV